MPVFSKFVFALSLSTVYATEYTLKFGVGTTSSDIKDLTWSSSDDRAATALAFAVANPTEVDGLGCTAGDSECFARPILTNMIKYEELSLTGEEGSLPSPIYLVPPTNSMAPMPMDAASTSKSIDSSNGALDMPANAAARVTLENTNEAEQAKPEVVHERMFLDRAAAEAERAAFEKMTEAERVEFIKQKNAEMQARGITVPPMPDRAEMEARIAAHRAAAEAERAAFEKMTEAERGEFMKKKNEEMAARGIPTPQRPELDRVAMEERIKSERAAADNERMNFEKMNESERAEFMKQKAAKMEADRVSRSASVPDFSKMSETQRAEIMTKNVPNVAPRAPLPSADKSGSVKHEREQFEIKASSLRKGAA